MADRGGYIGRNPGDSSVTIARQTNEPTGVQTTFNFLSQYTPGLLDVYVNGSRLIDISDYSATDGNTISLVSPVDSGDVVEFVAYKAFNVTTIDSAPGNLTVGTNLTVGGYISAGGTITGTALYGSGVNLTGIVTGITAGDNISVSGSTGNVTITGLANTSNVVADTLVVSGVSTLGSVTSSGVNVTGVVTATTLKVGTAITASSGIITATSFVGSGADLTDLNIPAGFTELDAALFN